MLPVTSSAVLVLLVVALLCLGSWINTFKAVSTKWRFELFSLDLSIGALLLAVIAAFTVGGMGADLGFNDRILVAGRTAQAFAFLAGAVFNLGGMLLLASVSLLGIAAAFPLAVGVALIVASCFQFRSDNIIYLAAGIVIVLASIALEIRAARLRESALEAKRETAVPFGNSASASGQLKTRIAGTATPALNARKPAKNAKKKIPQRAVRGMIAAVIAGVPLGSFVPILQNCLPGEFGLGAYAAMVLFGLGVFASAIVYNFYFLNIAIDGAPLTFAAYFRGKWKHHLSGILGGAMCMAGLLAAALAIASPASQDIAPVLRVLLPLLSIPLAVLFGIAVWREVPASAASRTAVLAGLVLFLCSLGLLSFGFTR